MIQVEGPAVLVFVPVAGHVPAAVLNMQAVVDEIPVEGAEAFWTQKVAQLCPFLKSPFLHVALIKRGVGIFGDGPVEGNFHIKAVLIARVTEAGKEKTGLALRLHRKDEIGGVEYRKVPDQEPAIPNDSVAAHGHIENPARNAPVGRVAVTAGARGIFQMVGYLGLLFDPFPFDIEMVFGDKHHAVVHRSRSRNDIERDLFPLQDVLIAMEQNMADGQCLVRGMIQGNGVGLQIPPRKGDQDVPFGVIDVFFPVIGNVVGINVHGPAAKIRLERLQRRSRHPANEQEN